MRRAINVHLLAVIVASCVCIAPLTAFAGIIDRGDIVFAPGASSATITGSIVRGDSDQYSLVSSAGQWMEVSISSVEDNAVFDLSIYSYGTGQDVYLEGAREGDDATAWQGRLPDPGYSKDGTQNVVTIKVGATRGNASYQLRLSIRDQPLRAVQSPVSGSDAQSRSAHGKYQTLKQTLHCPQDRAQYGEFADYGYWEGGPWCGQTGQAGYWVWVPPNWYVWAEKPLSHGKATAGTLTSLTMGDRGCYVEFVDAAGRQHHELASFDVCEQANRLHEQVSFSYQQENVLAASCGGDPECRHSEAVWIIDAMQ